MSLSRRWAVRSRRRNRWLAPLLLRLPGFVLVHHLGRQSNRSYATPLRLMPGTLDGRMYVVLTYGPSSDWFRNLEANPGTVEVGGRCLNISGVNVVAVETLPKKSRWQQFQVWVIGRLEIESAAELRLDQGA